MSAVAHRAGAGDTSNALAYTIASFTPTAGDLLVIVIAAVATTDNTPTLTESAGGGTYTLRATQDWAGTGNRLFIFVANQLVGASPPARTMAFTLPADAATGIVYSVEAVTSITKVGAAAVKQVTPNNAANKNSTGTPAITGAGAFPAACLTTNPVIVAAAISVNPAGLTPPATFTELVDTGFATPNTGLETAKVDSGFTGTTVTWGSGNTVAYGAIGIELDASAAGGGSFTGTPSDTGLSMSDSAVGVKQAARGPSDTSAAADGGVARALVSFRTPSDTSSAADGGAARVKNAPRSATDTGITPGDSVAVALARGRNPSDTSQAADGGAARALVSFRAPADTGLTFSDSAARLKLASRSATDTGITLSDAAARALSASRAPADTSLATDAGATRTLSALRAPSDTSQAADGGATAVKSGSQFSRTPTDTGISFSDALIRSLTSFRAPADTSAVTDAGVVRTALKSRTATDTGITASDSTARAKLTFRTPADTLAIADSASRTLKAFRTPADIGVTITDFADRAVEGEILVGSGTVTSPRLRTRLRSSPGRDRVTSQPVGGARDRSQSVGEVTITSG